ncbi:MAG: flagellar protein FlgN [Proteobacteria bacterium]|nr:MAG: flagellar protein FlgN [Pseudomonadota bacterium]
MDDGGSATMDGLILPNLEELQKNLRHQLALYRQLVDLLREEKEHMVAVRTKEVRECTYSKEALLDEIHREEYRRRRWVAEAAAALGLPEKEITIELVATRLAPEQLEAYTSLKSTLVHMIKRAREMNDDNRRLAETALQDLQTMKKNILGLTADKPQTYGAKGTMGTGSRDQSARLLNKEA